MNEADFVGVVDKLWPNHKLPAPVMVELSRRVVKLPLDLEQVQAALTDYRIGCGQYEQTTPNAGKLGQMLRAKAFPASGQRSPGSSEAEPAPVVQLYLRSEWRRANADLIRKQMESACDCERYAAVVGYGPNGSDGICRRCGGSFAGKFLKYGGGIGQ